MTYFTITNGNTLVQHTDSPASEIQFSVTNGIWTQTQLPNGTPVTVSDSATLSMLNAQLVNLQPRLPRIPGFTFDNGVYRGPTAVAQF